MKLTTLLLTVFLAQVSASSYAQRITLQHQSLSLKKAFTEIRKQTGHIVLYETDLLQKTKPMTVNIKNASLDEALHRLLGPQGLDFEIEDKSIVIRMKSKTSKIQVNNETRTLEEQQQPIRGKVVNEKGERLVGATVRVHGSEIIVMTNEAGEFEIKHQGGPVKLLISYIGYSSKEIAGNGDLGTITMNLSSSEMDEVLLNAGYYSVKDKERTGSISKITSKEIGQQPVANPLAAMQGRMAGVNITQSSGTPGGGFDIQIRGRNSLRTEGNAPLYIVDGVPYVAQSVSNFSISGGILPSGNVSPLNGINPNDIESIEVLKDADATAIYGSRGSNGVVLITTKKGSSDKTTFSVQTVTSVSTVARFMNLMHTEEYLKMRRDAYKNDAITDYPANAYDVNGTWDPNRYTDWQKEFIGGKAVSQNTQFSIAGGSGQTTYLMSGSHRKDGTVFPGDFGYKRTNFLLNVNHQSKDSRFNFQGNIQKNMQKNNLMASDLATAVYLAPNAPALYDENGNLNWENNTFENPLAKLNSKYLSDTDELTSLVKLSYKPFSKLILSIQGGITNAGVNEVRTLPSTVMNPALGMTSENSSVRLSKFNRNNWIIEPTANYSIYSENSKWEFLTGSTFEERKQTHFGIQASNFISNDFIMNIKSAAIQSITNDTETVYRYNAVFGRINYNLHDRYYVNITGRRDGSSRFGANNRFGNFAAAGGAWLFSREKFFENSSWLSFGKLRASYGTSGSDLIGDYQYLNTLGLANYKYDGQIALDPLRLYNPDFSWETNKKLEAAMELELFNGRIAASAAWYRNRSSNQLVGVPLPGTTGFSTLQANLAATVENRGWEFTMRSVNIEKDGFTWKTDVNVSLPKNKLIAFPNLEESTYANRYEVGQPTSIRKVYRLLGVNKETGLYEFDDVNNDGKIDVNDRTTVVNIAPTLFGGISNQIRLNKWSLDMLWQFVIQKAYTPEQSHAMMGVAINQRSIDGNYFSPENPDAFYQQPATESNGAATQAFNNFMMSDGVIADASFLRLKSLQVNYDFTELVKSNVRVSTYLQAYNLLTFTSYTGSDPETATGHLPALRTIALGLNINF
ncbi:TonB-linked outer membrane protein, SusC/RagA family [Sphingobacterium nematocida]|uniref:TonB-linked outer membrane protein, SusC/RagA family n=2 Tax=Sphingobacterium nematocida TaxID=1513896 RepID=A0A1T5EKJ2_9SPHI|nr:TonB-linked outer membrane protein, SusC/RagA family [Sphingobacterium nematocida]